jgi:hypothetical protein
MIQNTRADWRQRYTLCFAAKQPERDSVSRFSIPTRSLRATMFVSPGGERAGATDPLSPHLLKLNA